MRKLFLTISPGSRQAATSYCFAGVPAPISMAILFPLLLAVYGCGPSQPNDLIDEDTYIDILTEMYLLASIKNIHQDDDLYRKGQDTVLSHYDITTDQFERSHSFYFQDIEAQQGRFRRVRERLNDASMRINEYTREKREELEGEHSPDHTSNDSSQESQESQDRTE